MARNRELSLRLQGADATSARSWWGWDSHKLEPGLVSAALAFGLHAAVFSVPVRMLEPSDFSERRPGVRSVNVRTLTGTAVSALSTGQGSSAVLAMSYDSVVGSPQAEPSATKLNQDPPVSLPVEPVQASPAVSGLALRVAGVLRDEDFFSRQALDVGPHPTLPVLIDYPSFGTIGGTHSSELSLFIDETGRVVKVRVDGTTLPPAMEEAARSAFMGTVFSPGLIDGLPVRARIRIEVIFEAGAAAR